MKNFDRRLASGATDQGPVRTNNQDAYFIPQETDPVHFGALYIVADGVGGQEHGATAAQMAVRIVSEAFYRARANGVPIQGALQEALHQANRAIVAEAEERGGGRMGSTIVVTVQDEGQLYVAHVGDARAYLLHEGKLRRMTRDDTWVQKQVEAGTLTAEEAANHELRNVVTQVLGNKEEIEVHLSKPYELQQDDILLLCSDGLYDPVPGPQIEKILRDQSPTSAAAALVAEAVGRQATDNVTAVVVHSGRVGRAIAAPRRLPLPSWALIAGGALLLVLLVGGGYALFGGNDSGSEAASSAPIPTRSSAATLPTAAPKVAALLEATSTVAPTPTGTPLPTETPPPPTPTPLPLVCVQFDNTFVWSDAALNADCAAGNVFADANFDEGTVVRLLPDAPRTVRGPDSSCLTSQFRKVSTLENPPQTVGWILANSFEPMPSAACPPP